MDGDGTGERQVFLNGDLVPESRAAVSIRDAGFVYGDQVFDTARTFGGRVFMLEAHLDRLFDSLAYVRIDPGMSRDALAAATARVVAANLPLLREGEDYWVTIRVTSGLQPVDGEPRRNSGATVLVECLPLPLRARAGYFRTGIPAVIPARRRIAPDALSPNAKTSNYLNMMLAQREVSAVHPGGWALMCDRDGNIAEGAGCNFFAVKGDVVHTPTTDHVLAGVTRAVAMDLCAELGIPLRETRVPVQLALTAEEAFFTSTSLCICPVASLDGKPYAAGIPGPVTARLMQAFAERVGLDYVGQYLRFATGEAGSTGL